MQTKRELREPFTSSCNSLSRAAASSFVKGGWRSGSDAIFTTSHAEYCCINPESVLSATQLMLNAFGNTHRVNTFTVSKVLNLQLRVFFFSFSYILIQKCRPVPQTFSP